MFAVRLLAGAAAHTKGGDPSPYVRGRTGGSSLLALFLFALT
jgi:hypothetical protein